MTVYAVDIDEKLLAIAARRLSPRGISSVRPFNVDEQIPGRLVVQYPTTSMLANVRPGEAVNKCFERYNHA